MDIYRISSDLSFVNQIGATLNIEERSKLQLALIKITEVESFDQVLLWGKIEGVAKDYYIALALKFRQFEFPNKKFFYSSNDFNFVELPQIDNEYKDKVDNFRQLFTGSPEKVLIPLPENQENQEEQQQQQQDPEDSDADQDIKVQPKPFTELDRLAYVVRAIENDCALAPHGAYKLTPIHELRYNDSFKGLSIQDLAQSNKYQHFRAPQSEEKQKLIARDDALFSFDFLDPIDQDLPKGQWSIQTDSSKTNVTIRSLQWPGFVSYHRANSQIFGNIYIGNGIKNCDLPFLL